MQTLVFEEIIKLQSRGVLTIPKKFREALNFRDNSIVKLRKDKYRLIIEPLRTLPYPVRNYTDKDLKDFFEFDKKESKQLRKKGFL